MRVLLAQINPIVGDISYNQAQILAAIAAAKKNGCDIALTSEMALTGYPPEDLLLLNAFVEQAESALQMIIQATQNITAIVGTCRKNPLGKGNPLHNTAAIISNGSLVGYQDKMLLPTYDVFNEKRYFEPAQENKPWDIGGHKVAITICEDIWGQQRSGYHVDPIEMLAKKRVDLLLNLSASPFSENKLAWRLSICQKVAKTLRCPVLYCNQVGGNDSLIFDGYSFATTEKGDLSAVAKGFSSDYLIVDSDNLTSITSTHDPISDLYNALVLGVKDYFQKSGFTKACIGLSGGIDSSLVCCIAKDALGSENVLAVAMPSPYSTESSLEDAASLAKNLQIALKIIPIDKPFQVYLDLLTPEFEDKPSDVTEENIQARIRGMILMALSNKLGYIVLSTGNKSELALGYSTLYGDMCGGLAVISDLTKKQVYALARYINQKGAVIPSNTLTKPPSAELRPNQKDSDTLPDYAIVDAVLKDYIEKGHTPQQIATDHHLEIALVRDLIAKIHLNEYKRRQSPPGLRVSEKAFSIGRRFPIVQRFMH